MLALCGGNAGCGVYNSDDTARGASGAPSSGIFIIITPASLAKKEVNSPIESTSLTLPHKGGCPCESGNIDKLSFNMPKWHGVRFHQILDILQIHNDLNLRKMHTMNLLPLLFQSNNPFLQKLLLLSLRKSPDIK